MWNYMRVTSKENFAATNSHYKYQNNFLSMDTHGNLPYQDKDVGQNIQPSEICCQGMLAHC